MTCELEKLRTSPVPSQMDMSYHSYASPPKTKTEPSLNCAPVPHSQGQIQQQDMNKNKDSHFPFATSWAVGKSSLPLLLPTPYHVILCVTKSPGLQHHHFVGLLNKRPSPYYGFDIILLMLTNHLRVLLNIQLY